jgi:hypothetical protein
MAIGIGDVVWLNAGQGPYTVTSLSTDAQATMTQGNSGSLQAVPLVCLTKKNPTPKLEFDRELLKASYLAAGSSLVGSSN